MLCYSRRTPFNKKVGKVMSKYAVSVQLSGNDGNAFAIMGAVKSALKKAGASKEEIEQYLSDSMSGDYDNLLRVAMEWVKVK
jgi:hypothetical protein